jgi:hypothetical protein
MIRVEGHRAALLSGVVERSVMERASGISPAGPTLTFFEATS